MPRYRSALLLLFGWLALSATTRMDDRWSCLNGLGPALELGGFTGSMDCNRHRLTVRRVGTVQSFGRSFTIYDYRYELAQICKECAIHGGQRILFLSQGRYLGQYKPNSLDVRIRRGNLVLSPAAWGQAPPSPPVTISFTRDGPPQQVLVDGELLGLFR